MQQVIILMSKWNYIKFSFKKEIIEFGGDNERADVIFWYDGYQKWNWKDKKTFCDHHKPGITKKAVDFLVKKKCKIIILSKGYGNPSFTRPGVLETSSAIKKYLKDIGIKVYNLKSETAIKMWNKLIKKNKKVGMYLHSTC
tara:strand:+ start:124 stop:546 length:423 start_codon:yes stop_codon:yes gene_type:complete